MPTPSRCGASECRRTKSPAVYDPAGEAIERERDIEGHRFLSYLDGLALLIDPFSLPSLVRMYREAGHDDLPPATADANQGDVIHRIVNVLETQAGLVRKKRFQRRIAVILTKADIPFVQDQLVLAMAGSAGEPWHDRGDDGVRFRNWLSQHEPGLLQSLETRFATL